MPRVRFLRPDVHWPVERHVAVVAYITNPVDTEWQAYFYDSFIGDHGRRPASDWKLWDAVGFARNLAEVRGIDLLAIRADGISESVTLGERLAAMVAAGRAG